MPGRHGESDRRMRVIWQAPTREFREVGELLLPAEGAGGVFRFHYVEPLPPEFNPFLAFPDVSQLYESTNLFPFFRNRIMSAVRPDYESHLTALGLTVAEATPFEILARTAGERSTDSVQVVAHETHHEDGSISQLFLSSGLRYFTDQGVESSLSKLCQGDTLRLRDQPDNDFDARAILLETERGCPVGYVPSYLLDLVHKARDERFVSVTVVRANGPSVPWHLRLLCRLDAAAPGVPGPHRLGSEISVG